MNGGGCRTNCFFEREGVSSMRCAVCLAEGGGDVDLGLVHMGGERERRSG